jgi:hypothetical protein
MIASGRIEISACIAPRSSLAYSTRCLIENEMQSSRYAV